jgi:cytochrome c5
MLKRFGRIWLLVAGVAALPVACEDDHQHAPGGMPTGSTCPTTQTLTYANFGQAFFDSYCQRCHASTVTGPARMGAPADHVFDMVQDIQLLSHHIDELAAAGPDAVNTEMPPDGAKPTEAERRQLGEWLACGAP